MGFASGMLVMFIALLQFTSVGMNPLVPVASVIMVDSNVDFVGIWS